MSIKTALFSHFLRRFARCRSMRAVLSQSASVVLSRSYLHMTSASVSVPPTPPLLHVSLFPPVIMAAVVPTFLGSPVAIFVGDVTTSLHPAAAAPLALRCVAVTPRAAVADDSIVNPESTGFAADAKKFVTDGKTKMEKKIAA